MGILDKTKRQKRRRLAVAVLAVALVVGLGTWRASLRVGTGPAVGVGLVDPVPEVPAAQSTWRVGTWNIAGGKGPDGRQNLAAAAKTLEGLDLVALQEVRGSVGFDEANQAEWLGQRLGLGWLYAPAETRWYSRQFGNGVLGRLPVRHWQRIPLPRVGDRSRRNVVLLVVEAPTRPIRVLATHLTQRDPRDRRVQLRAVIEFFLSLEEPAILLGDLNTPPDDPTMVELVARDDVDDPLARLLVQPPLGRVDWILVRGLHCTGAGTRDEGVSDHPLYWVEIERPGHHRNEPPGQNKLQ